jgi:glycosyltransferase involved in cell wall biosynthesis
MTLSVPKDMLWEIIIVDNNSADRTKDVIEEFRARSGFNVVYAFEEKKGLSHARNCGIQAAQGEIIAFTDDDVIVDKDWLGSIEKTFEENDIACAGGKIVPFWEKSPPPWLKKELYGYIALLDFGDECIRMTRPGLYGANFAVKSSMFEKYGCFNTTIGRTPTKLYGGEETDFMGLLIRKKEAVYYSPSMVVHHCIPEDRMQKAYFRKWAYDQGELTGIRMGNQPLRGNMRRLVRYGINVIKGVSKIVWFQAVNPHRAFREHLKITYYIVAMAMLFTRKLAHVFPPGRGN